VTQQTDRLNAALDGRYRIERHLGEGGMAQVYLCEDIKHKRKVALKLLKPELAAVLGAERFVQEITTTAALQHPHILPLFDSGTADGFLFYVMPYIQGETLREKLNREAQLGVDEAVRIARDVADALDYAHRNGVIHRDIKPENILLHDGRPMVADFGIALAVSAAAGGRMTETGLSLGTPHYMSPEQATAEKEITARSDIYSVGSVLYEMLTGNPPFVGAVAQQIIMKIITEPAEPVTKYRKSVPQNVAAAVAKALEKLPADRFESAKAFAEALGNPNYTSAGGAAAATEARAASWGGRRGLYLSWGVTALALAVGVAGWVRRQPSAMPVVRFPVPIKSGQTLQAARSDAPFALSPDGTRIAYVAIDSGASSATLHLRALDQFAATSLPGTENAAAPFFSPDGHWIGFITTNREIKKVAVSGGPVTLIATGATLFRGAPSWGDDHSIIAYFAPGMLMRVGDGGGAPAMVLDTVSGSGMAPFVLPGSRAALVTVCPMSALACNGDLGVLDLAAGTVKVIVPGAARGWYLSSGHLVYGDQEGKLFAVKFDLQSLEVTSAPVAVLDGIQTTRFALPAVAISASGTMAYLTGGASGPSRVIVQVDRAGLEEVIVRKPGSYEVPRLSPDGRRIALANEDAQNAAQIWIHDRASGTTRQLTFDGISTRPAWSPDGKRVAFSTARGGTRVGWKIWSAPIDGSDPGALAVEGPGLTGGSAVSWTRDGKWIVTDGPPEDGKGAGGEDIFAIPTSGSPRTMRPVVASRFNEQTGEVSPDGKWIAYVSNETGQYQIYVQPFLAPGGRTLISAGRVTEPVWVSSSELAYMNNDTDSLTLARLELGATPRVSRTPLFDVRNYVLGNQGYRNFDVSRDGKSFIFLKQLEASKAVEPIVVLNWAEEVKRLMAAAGIK
jgi:Tol biopolymer transport system component/tRNA A-37 threonylcarbamoyl transferase component Bud32